MKSDIHKSHSEVPTWSFIPVGNCGHGRALIFSDPLVTSDTS